MITELVLSSSLIYGYKYLRNKQRIFKNIIKNVFEAHNMDYKIIDASHTDKVYKVIVSLINTGFEKLEKSKDILESSLGNIVEIKQNDNLKTATIFIITERLSDSYPYKPIQIKSYELYIGKTYTMKDVILSMKELPHCLFSGINSSGKTYCLLTALTNLITQYSDKSIELFLSQVSAKKDLRKFMDCIQCRGYAQDLPQAYDMFSYLYHTMEKRISMFNNIKNKFIDDIYEWNNAFPTRQMRIIYLAMDEFTSYMPDSLDGKEEGELKQQCLDMLVKLIQQSRCTGIYILASLQRPDKESLPPRLKSQFNCKVSFKQSNIASSLVVTDSDKAFHLKPKREAIVNADDEYLMKTLYLDNKMIANYIKDSLDLSHPNYYNKKSELTNTTELTDTKSNSTKKSKSKVKVKNVPDKKR